MKKMSDNGYLEFVCRASKRISYDPETGKMVWKKKENNPQWNARLSGKECGTENGKGYIMLRFSFENSKILTIKAHRMAWFIFHGKMPLNEIDHINQNKCDNRICNLRDVPKSINQRNAKMRRDNISGVTGVQWHKKNQKWTGNVCVDGKNFYIGSFETKDEAKNAVMKFRAKNGFLVTHGKS